MARTGRPRSFDRQKVLHQAMYVFWQRGYEGASQNELQAAMGGISPPSMYAAFGSKEKLFREAVELYAATIGGSPIRALTAKPTAREAVEAMLVEAADLFGADTDTPQGCMMITSALNCTPASQSVHDHLQQTRQQAPAVIAQRLERAVADGDLPAGLDLAAIASFYVTVWHGLAVRGHDGATRAQLRAAADAAMAAWDRLTAQP
jgi:AcrR family transcriptional regulator